MVVDMGKTTWLNEPDNNPREAAVAYQDEVSKIANLILLCSVQSRR